MKAYHSPKDTRAFGGVGQTFEDMLDQLLGFVQSNPTEFVIVRLAHIKDSQEVFEFLLNWMDKLATRTKKKGEFVFKGTGNLANMFVHELAGKVVFVVESKKLKAAKFPGRGGVPGQTDGFHTLYQNKKGKPLPDVLDGLCMCGEFASDNNLEKIVASQTTSYTLHDKHRTHADNKLHLYCLYWTSTGGNIEEHTVQMSANFRRVRDLVASQLQGTAAALLDNDVPLVNTREWSNAIRVEDRARLQYAVFSVSLPNIILYDFVNSDTSEEIIGLNDLVLTGA